MMKVLHLFGTSVLGRSPRKWIQNEFEKHGVFFHVHIEDMSKPAHENVNCFIEMMSEQQYDWLFGGWEMFNGYKNIWEHPNRKFKVAIFLQEQPQRLFDVNCKRPFCDILLTSSPIFQSGTNGYLPNPVHTAYIEDRILPWNEKDNSILISGSYRTCRMELFKQLFREQPFKWPVFFFPPNNEKEIKNIQVIDEISSFHPEYVLRGSGERDKYNKEILKHLNKTKIFVDCTFNPYPNLHISHANGTLEEIEKVLPTYLGGYAPERVLDACYMGNTVVALHNKALNFVLRDNLIFYSNYKELVEKIREAIEHEEINLKPFATESQKLVKDYTTEEVIKHLAEMFKTGKYSNPYQDRRHT